MSRPDREVTHRKHSCVYIEPTSDRSRTRLEVPKSERWRSKKDLEQSMTGHEIENMLSGQEGKT